ncbi:MAG: HAD hydrolase-like protein [Candidatus ainarchaeum sp.]|nr:HAD hydrolase-like protein [Candidatus ainarchaeum sp.]
MTLQAIGFDFDDTIMERELAEVQAQAQEFVKIWGGNSTQIAKKVFAELRGRPPRMNDYFAAAKRVPTNGDYKKFEPVFLDARESIFLKFSRKLATKGVIKFLKGLGKEKMFLFIISGSPVEKIIMALEKMGVDPRIFSQINMSRQKAQTLKEVLQTKGINPRECLFIGDSKLDHTAATEVGTHFIGIRPRRSERQHNELTDRNARVLNSFSRMDKVLKEYDNHLGFNIREHILAERARRRLK